jgi:hypothetical protein
MKNVGAQKMTENIEIFENEQATKFLDYYIAYMKLVETVDNIKNIAAQHIQVNRVEEQPTEQQHLQ